jgi:hypothetical protein
LTGACGLRHLHFPCHPSGREIRPEGWQGKWGAGIKKISICNNDKDDEKGTGFYITVGDGYDLGEREGNMPKFDASYRRVGNASCTR